MPYEPLGTDEITRAKILDAAFVSVARLGAKRTTMADVSREAGLSRQTVYRYFPNKHELFGALVLREEQRLVTRVRAAVAKHRDLRPALEASFYTSLKALREHPLLDRVLATEPQEILPYLTVEANPLLEMSMRFTQQVLTERLPDASPLMIHRASEICARVFLSYAIK